MLFALFSLSTFVPRVHNSGGKNKQTNLGSLSTNHGTCSNYRGVIAFFTTMHLELKTKYDEAVKIITFIVSPPLSICLFIILCDKMRKA